MDQIQSFLKNRPRMPGLPYIVNYKCSAHELSDKIKDNAYGKGELPVDADFPELAMLLGDNKMRGRSKGPSWLQHVPDECKNLVMAQVNKGQAPMNCNYNASQSSGVHSLPLAPQQPLPSADLMRLQCNFADRHAMHPQLAEKPSEKSKLALACELLGFGMDEVEPETSTSASQTIFLLPQRCC